MVTIRYLLARAEDDAWTTRCELELDCLEHGAEAAERVGWRGWGKVTRSSLSGVALEIGHQESSMFLQVRRMKLELSRNLPRKLFCADSRTSRVAHRDKEPRKESEPRMWKRSITPPTGELRATETRTVLQSSQVPGKTFISKTTHPWTGRTQLSHHRQLSPKNISGHPTTEPRFHTK